MRSLWIVAMLASAVACAGMPRAETLHSANGPQTALALTSDVEAPHVETLEEPPTVLPAAPWSERILSEGEVPEQVIQAWRRADNRDWCAPVAPEGLAGERGRARASTLHGGWAVEFDRRGARGVMRSGQLCERCGRSAFGIAGTARSPAQLVDAESEMDFPTPSFADGSHASIDASDEGVAAATITVPDQGCVYQVWSFLGEEHLRGLVDRLRRVETASDL